MGIGMHPRPRLRPARVSRNATGFAVWFNLHSNGVGARNHRSLTQACASAVIRLRMMYKWVDQTASADACWRERLNPTHETSHGKDRQDPWTRSPDHSREEPVASGSEHRRQDRRGYTRCADAARSQVSAGALYSAQGRRYVIVGAHRPRNILPL